MLRASWEDDALSGAGRLMRRPRQRKRAMTRLRIRHSKNSMLVTFVTTSLWSTPVAHVLPLISIAHVCSPPSGLPRGSIDRQHHHH